MDAHFKTLAAAALKLTSIEREAFVQLLLTSLNAEPGLDEAWAVEVDRRIADLESSAVTAIPMADALAQIRKSLK